MMEELIMKAWANGGVVLVLLVMFGGVLKWMMGYISKQGNKVIERLEDLGLQHKEMLVTMRKENGKD